MGVCQGLELRRNNHGAADCNILVSTLMSNRRTVDRLVAIRDDASSFFGSRSAMQRWNRRKCSTVRFYKKRAFLLVVMAVATLGAGWLAATSQFVISAIFFKPLIAFNCVLVPVYAYSTGTRVEG